MSQTNYISTIIEKINPFSKAVEDKRQQQVYAVLNEVEKIVEETFSLYDLEHPLFTEEIEDLMYTLTTLEEVAPFSIQSQRAEIITKAKSIRLKVAEDILPLYDIKTVNDCDSAEKAVFSFMYILAGAANLSDNVRHDYTLQETRKKVGPVLENILAYRAAHADLEGFNTACTTTKSMLHTISPEKMEALTSTLVGSLTEEAQLALSKGHYVTAAEYANDLAELTNQKKEIYSRHTMKDLFE
jgi:hypothetical protein